MSDEYISQEEAQRLKQEKRKRNRYINNFIAEKYDRITILSEPGTKEKLAAQASKNGFKSVGAYINFLIAQALKTTE